MVTPVIFYNLVLSVGRPAAVFHCALGTESAAAAIPEGTTNFYMVYFYKQAFTFQNMGYGATLA